MRAARLFVLPLVVLGALLLVGSPSVAVVLNDSDDTVTATKADAEPARTPSVAGIESDALDASDEEETATRRTARDRRRSCKQRIRQIVRQDDTISLAKARGQVEWHAAATAHLARLESDLKDRCPELYVERMKARRMVRMARDMKKLMELAAKYAIKYFTGGLSGFY